MAEFRGTISETELFPFVRFLADLRRTGSLYITHDGWAAQLHFLDGRLVAASFRNERGLSAITALASALTRADFVYTDGPLVADDLLDIGPDLLNSNHGPQLPPPNRTLPLDAIPQRTSALADNNERLSLKRSTVKSLLAVDGRRTIREILSDTTLAARLLDLVELRDLGLISIDSTVPNPVALGPSLTTLGHPGVPAQDRQTPAALAASTPRVFADDRPATETPSAPACTGCPMLGLADNPSSHFERPTALHRCYADGSSQSVTSLQQRDLCLTQAYSTCPRLHSSTKPSRTRLAFAQPLHPTSDLSEEDEALVAISASGWKTRVGPAASIALAIAAVVANYVVFVRPHFG